MSAIPESVLVRRVRTPRATAPSAPAPAPATATAITYLIDDTLSVLRLVRGSRAERVALPPAMSPLEITVAGGLLHVLALEGTTQVILSAVDPTAAGWTQLRLQEEVRRIAVSPNGHLWAIDATRHVRIVNRATGTLEPAPAPPAEADEISVGADGKVWIISTEERYAGRVVKWLDRGETSWQALPPPSAAVKVAAAGNGLAWTINSLGALWRLHPLGSGNFAECQVATECERCVFGNRRHFARDVAVDASDVVWALGVELAATGGYQVLYLADPASKRFEVIADVGAIRLAAG